MILFAEVRINYTAALLHTYAKTIYVDYHVFSWQYTITCFLRDFRSSCITPTATTASGERRHDSHTLSTAQPSSCTDLFTGSFTYLHVHSLVLSIAVVAPMHVRGTASIVPRPSSQRLLHQPASWIKNSLIPSHTACPFPVSLEAGSTLLTTPRASWATSFCGTAHFMVWLLPHRCLMSIVMAGWCFPSVFRLLRPS